MARPVYCGASRTGEILENRGPVVDRGSQPNEVCHIWAYSSLNARAEFRAKALEDPVWKDFLGKGLSWLDEMHSTIILPAPHSSLQ
jgi:hypothetical protein